MTRTIHGYPIPLMLSESGKMVPDLDRFSVALDCQWDSLLHETDERHVREKHSWSEGNLEALSGWRGVR